MGCLVTFIIMNGRAPSVPKTITKYLPATKLLDFEDSWNYKPPTYRFIFNQSDKEPEVVEKKVYVPVSYGDSFTFAQREPIDIGRTSVKYRYYDPEIQSEVIDEFQYADKRFRYGLYVDADLPLIEAFGTIRDMEPVIGPRIQFNYRGIGLGVATYYSFSEEKFLPVIKASYKLTGN